ncbi:MAG: hypothetical protein HY901_25500 [Deltaproteobacteria bacterium]|nr:hypothetical protein [Deltaproteobacteria bacterium]
MNRALTCHLLAAFLAPVALLGAASCSEADLPDAGLSDAAMRSDGGAQNDATTRSDAAREDAALGEDAALAEDAATPPDASTSVDGGPDTYGFTIRVPQERTIPMAEGGTATVWDTDYVCTFTYGEFGGYFYLQATPTEHLDWRGVETRTEGGWLSFAQVVTPASGALYDWGGNHHNDSMELDYQGKRFRYGHSTFGWGFRKCMPPDCLQVYQGTTLLDDGCQPDRRLPVVCVQVAEDGTVAPLVDQYRKCPGDPNAAFDGGL